MAESVLEEFNPPNTPQPSTPLPSTPLHLSGFLSGDTIQVEGNTGDLQFSVQLNILKKHDSGDRFPFTGTNSLENIDFCENSSFSSHMNLNSIHELEHPNTYADPLAFENHGMEETGECVTPKTDTIRTRLRTGVLSPVTYFPKIPMTSPGNAWSSGNVQLRKKHRRKREDLLERVLRRHSSPIRPCSSYTFFVMATWGLVKSSSFGVASKKLGQMWCKLPHSEKKVFKDMAFKDSARYKRQCMLMKNKE
ncbi:HMG_box domain-containing protein [Cephalotus follicularis]|uniref:HMG_box domain-containing protein n=1 Tax=Cephalotus follicularis TaxID=3775 RepID=A0A1Q3BZH0_CEPFO|nr:HMG_box domain-containing protein [Cephalotus follicularis]